MPLSAAERSRRYRERIKQKDPEKYRQVKIRGKERAIKAYRAKWACMTEEQKKEQRAKWRQHKKCQLDESKFKNRTHTGVGKRKSLQQKSDQGSVIDSISEIETIECKQEPSQDEEACIDYTYEETPANENPLLDNHSTAMDGHPYLNRTPTSLAKNSLHSNTLEECGKGKPAEQMYWESFNDADAQFLLSFRHDLSCMSRSQKLEFKLGMIKLIQKITDR